MDLKFPDKNYLLMFSELVKFVKKENSLLTLLRIVRNLNTVNSQLCTECLMYAKHCRKREKRKVLPVEGI
jgi:hypothetical protein